MQLQSLQRVATSNSHLKTEKMFKAIENNRPYLQDFYRKAKLVNLNTTQSRQSQLNPTTDFGSKSSMCLMRPETSIFESGGDRPLASNEHSIHPYSITQETHVHPTSYKTNTG